MDTKQGVKCGIRNLLTNELLRRVECVRNLAACFPASREALVNLDCSIAQGAAKVRTSFVLRLNT